MRFRSFILPVLAVSTSLTMSGVLSPSAFAQKGQYYAPLSQWSILDVVDEAYAEKSYCIAAQQFEPEAIFTMAKNQLGDVSVAFDFEDISFSPGKVMGVELDPGAGEQRRFDVSPSSENAFVVRLEKDVPFVDALKRTGFLRVVFEEQNYSFDLSGIDRAHLLLSGCLAELKPDVASPVSDLFKGNVLSVEEIVSDDSGVAVESVDHANAPPLNVVSAVVDDLVPETLPDVSVSAPSEESVFVDDSILWNEDAVVEVEEPDGESVLAESVDQTGVVPLNGNSSAVEDLVSESLSDVPVPVSSEDNVFVENPVLSNDDIVVTVEEFDDGDVVADHTDPVDAVISQSVVSSVVEELVPESLPDVSVPAVSASKVFVRDEKLAPSLSAAIKEADDYDQAVYRALAAKRDAVKAKPAQDPRVFIPEDTVVVSEKPSAVEDLSVSSLDELDREASEPVVYRDLKDDVDVVFEDSVDEDSVDVVEDSPSVSLQQEMEQKLARSLSASAIFPVSSDVEDLQIASIEETDDRDQSAFAAKREAAKIKREEEARGVASDENIVVRLGGSEYSPTRSSSYIPPSRDKTYDVNERNAEGRVSAVLDHEESIEDFQETVIEGHLEGHDIALENSTVVVSELDDLTPDLDVPLVNEDFAESDRIPDVVDEIETVDVEDVAAKSSRFSVYNVIEELDPRKKARSAVVVEDMSVDDEAVVVRSPVVEDDIAVSSSDRTYADVRAEKLRTKVVQVDVPQVERADDSFEVQPFETVSSDFVDVKDEVFEDLSVNDVEDVRYFVPSFSIVGLLEDADIVSGQDIKFVEKASDADMAAHQWSVDNVFGSSEQRVLETADLFDDYAQAYLEKTQDRCGGDFAVVPNQSIDVDANTRVDSYDIACVGDGVDATASVIFFNQGDTFTALAHEAEISSMESAMAFRERLFSVIKES